MYESHTLSFGIHISITTFCHTLLADSRLFASVLYDLSYTFSRFQALRQRFVRSIVHFRPIPGFPTPFCTIYRTLRTDSRLSASVLHDLSYTSNGLLGFLNGPIRILDIQFITYRTPGAATDASTVPFSIFEVAARLPFSS